MAPVKLLIDKKIVLIKIKPISGNLSDNALPFSALGYCIYFVLSDVTRFSAMSG